MLRMLGISDLNGYTTTLSYSGGKLTSVTDPAGHQLTFTYSGSHIASVTDPMGRTTSHLDGVRSGRNSRVRIPASARTCREGFRVVSLLATGASRYGCGGGAVTRPTAAAGWLSR